MKLFFIFVVVFIMLLIHYCESQVLTSKDSSNNRINELIEKFQKSGYTDYYLVANLESCMSCNLAKINMILKSLKDKNKNSFINLIVESKYKFDSYYLKSDFKNFNFYEDNSIFLTSALKSNFILIASYKDSSFKYYKFNRLNEYFTKDYSKYINASDAIFNNSIALQEAEGHYLSNIVIVQNDKQKILIFDKNSKVLYEYNEQGEVIDFEEFTQRYAFYKGDDSLLNTLIDKGYILNEDIVSFKINNKNKSYELLYHMALIDVERDENNKLSITVRPVYANYKNGELINYKILGINNYADIFVDGKNCYLLLNGIPNFSDDTLSIINKFDPFTESDEEMILNKSIFEDKSNTKIKNLDFINSCLFIDDNNYLIISKVNKMIYYFIDDKVRMINLRGRVEIDSDFLIEDTYRNKDSLYIVLKDKMNLIVQIYELETGNIVNELIINISDNDYLISSNIVNVDERIKLLNRWKNKRWTFDSIHLNINQILEK